MAGLAPAIHAHPHNALFPFDFLRGATWMPVSSTGMTECGATTRVHSGLEALKGSRHKRLPRDAKI
jgi:hypothetical protein